MITSTSPYNLGEWTEVHTQLRDHLAEKLPDTDEARRYATSANMRVGRVKFSKEAIGSWHEVIFEALPIRQNKQSRLITVLETDFPNDLYLILLCQQIRTGGRSAVNIKDVEWLNSNTQSQKIIAEEVSSLLPVRFLTAGVIASRSVARVKIKTKTGWRYGTGFLVKDDIILTNNHVIGSIKEAEGAYAQFNYENSLDTSCDDQSQIRMIPSMGFATNVSDDWTAVRVEEGATQTWGFLQISSSVPKMNSRANIIQHPKGRPKEVTLHNNFILYADNSRIRYLTDTEPGSSGAPVLSDSWEVIGMHHTWGVEKESRNGRQFYRNQGIAAPILIHALTQAGLWK